MSDFSNAMLGSMLGTAKEVGTSYQTGLENQAAIKLASQRQSRLDKQEAVKTVMQAEVKSQGGITASTADEYSKAFGLDPETAVGMIGLNDTKLVGLKVWDPETKTLVDKGNMPAGTVIKDLDKTGKLYAYDSTKPLTSQPWYKAGMAISANDKFLQFDTTVKATAAGATDKQSAQVDSLTSLIDTMKQAKELYVKNASSGTGLAGKAMGVPTYVGGKFKTNPDAARYDALVSKTIPGLARQSGHSGVLTQLDVDSIAKSMPTMLETQNVGIPKFDQVIADLEKKLALSRSGTRQPINPMAGQGAAIDNMEFSSEEQIDAAVKAGKLQVGDVIFLNGVQGRVGE